MVAKTYLASAMWVSRFTLCSSHKSTIGVTRSAAVYFDSIPSQLRPRLINPDLPPDGVPMPYTEEFHRRLRVRATRGLALFAFAALSSAMLCRPALASDITVGNPVNGTHVASPLWIRAHNIGCESVPPFSLRLLHRQQHHIRSR